MKTLDQFLDESMGGGVPLTPQELEIQKKMSRLNVRLARKRSQQMQKAKVDDTETAPEQVKEASAVLDANTKISNKEKRDKIKKELDTLTKRAKLMKKHGSGYHPFLHREGEDKAFNYVVAKLRKQHGKDAVITKDNPIKPPTAAQKAKVRAHKAKLAKQDHRDPTEKASDGRYSDRYSNRGSD